MKFIGIIYYSFNGPKGSDVFEIERDTKEEAREKLLAEKSKRHSTFKKAGCRLIELDDGEELMDRNLSWKERLTGQIHPDRFNGDNNDKKD
jgi:hypothetical protein